MSTGTEHPRDDLGELAHRLVCAGECGGRLGAIYRAADGAAVVELYRLTDFFIDEKRNAPYEVERDTSAPGGLYVSGSPADLKRPQLRCPECGAAPTVAWSDIVFAIRRQPRRKSVVIRPDGTVAR